MTDLRDKPDAIERLCATLDALEAVVLTSADAPEIDPAEAEEVRRLVLLQTARRRRNTLPAAWVRRPGILPQLVPGAEPAPDETRPDEPTPPSPDRLLPLRPAWRE